jgi:RNA-directed DNA polymerase
VKQRSEKSEGSQGSFSVEGRGVSTSVNGRAASASQTAESTETLHEHLMERVCEAANLNLAFKRVRSNKGSPGIDGMTVEQLSSWIKTNKTTLIKSLLDGNYRPQPVRRVEIPKPGGGVRMLGIPTVTDRLVQQAILQIIQQIFEPHFSDSSYGFRPGRSAHDALAQARQYASNGCSYVVDIDLEKFFDRVNHDMLMARVAKRIKDKRLLRIVRRFLEAGIMTEGVVMSRHEGTPQGGPLSPLLSNILLDDLDKELEKRGHKFCRYADDCNVYVGSQAAAERILRTLTDWIERKLKLKVNRSKSAATQSRLRKFLGYVVHRKSLWVAKPSWERLYSKLISITKRRRPVSFAQRVEELNQLSRGWVQYFRYASSKTRLARLDEWLRRRLRCCRLWELKRAYPRVCFVMGLGIKKAEAWRTFKSGKGLWRVANTPVAKIAMNRQWFDSLGLLSFSQMYERVKG